MKYKILVLFIVLVATFPVSAMAEEIEDKTPTNRDSQEYENNRYELMSYSDASWYEFGDKTTNSVAGTVKNLMWQMNLALSNVVLIIVYQLFSLDIVDLTQDAVSSIAAAVAGGLVTQFGQFALAIFAIGIVVKAYINQNWAAFAKMTSLVVISMTLLFSISSERFDYIGIASSISKELENAIMNVNPTLTESDDLKINTENITDTAVALENKVFDALVYQPYLLLQYGTTDEESILEEDNERITAWLEADPRTEEGMEERDSIAEDEYKLYNNYNAYAGSGFEQAAYILVMMMSTLIQGFVFFCIALIRIGLQFGFIMGLLLAPFAIFLSLFPSFETIVGKYTKALFLVILFKAITMFFVLVAVSFISLGYDMTNTTDDMYNRIFIQMIMSVVIIFMYTKRHTVMNIIQGGDLSVDDMGGGRIPGQEKTASGAKRVGKRTGGLAGSLTKKGVSKLGGGIKKGAAAASSKIRTGSANLANRTKHSAAKTSMGVAAGAAAATAATRRAAANFKDRQLGGPDGENVYATAAETNQMEAKNEAAATKTETDKQSRLRKAANYIKQQQMGGPIGKEYRDEQGHDKSAGGTSVQLQGSGASTKRTQQSAARSASYTAGSAGTSGGGTKGKGERKAKVIGMHNRKRPNTSSKRSVSGLNKKPVSDQSRKVSKKKIEKVQRAVGTSRQSTSRQAPKKYRVVPPKRGKNLTKGEMQRMVEAKRQQSSGNSQFKDSYQKMNKERIKNIEPKAFPTEEVRPPKERAERERTERTGRLGQTGRLSREN
ncbi:hypothetical protein J26TS2_44840 [Shouchella clausii]|nr:hypothetical protein J26TS2_44840 [Shouchella clausii]